MATAFKAALSAPVPAPVSEKTEKPELRRVLPVSRSFLAIALAALVVAGVFIASRFEKKPGASTPAENPTQHIAHVTTTSNSNSQWTFGCLGESQTALVDLDCREIKIAVENRIL